MALTKVSSAVLGNSAVSSAKLNLTTLAAGNTTITGAATFSNTITVTGNTTFSNTVAIGSDYITPYAGFKNRIINGDMRIDQRNAGANVALTTAYGYVLDRWYFNISQNSKLSTGRNQGSVTPPAGFTYYMGITSAAAYTPGASETFEVAQNIEGYNIADFAWGTASAKTITLSFWVRSSLTGTFGGCFQNENNTRSYPFSYTISSANTWEQKSVTVTGCTDGTWNSDNNGGTKLRFNLGDGSNLLNTAGSWYSGDYRGVTGNVNVVGTSGATWQITGVQVEKGSTATSFDWRPFSTELQLCQRYYERSYDIGNTNGSFTSGWRGTCTNGTVYAESPGWSFSVTKRATPTVTLYNAVSGAAGAAYQVSSAANTAVSTRYIGTTGIGIIDYTSSGGQNSYYIHYTAAAEL